VHPVHHRGALGGVTALEREQVDVEDRLAHLERSYR
jgi:hypothetical protein